MAFIHFDANIDRPADIIITTTSVATVQARFAIGVANEPPARARSQGQTSITCQGKPSIRLNDDHTVLEESI